MFASNIAYNLIQNHRHFVICFPAAQPLTLANAEKQNSL